MANRIKDVLQPELYEYYKSHRGKYQRFASDIALLQAKLFKDMVDNGVLPKKKHGWEYECDCTVWLNDITLKINTFSDFHKLYKNRLKAFKFKSPEYYAECEKIVAENDVEFVRNAMRAKSIRNYVARNYSAPIPQEDNCNDQVVLESEDNTKQLKQIENTELDMAYYIDKNIIKYKAFDDSWKVTEVVNYRGYKLYKFIAGDYSEDGLPTNKAIELECMKWFALQNYGINSFSLFEKMFADRLSHYKKNDKSYYLECYYLVLKEKNKAKEQGEAKENEIKRADRKMTDKDREECCQIMFVSFMSFFFLGVIAYVLKHLIALAFNLIATILVIILNIFHGIFCLLFNIDGDFWIGDFDAISPMNAWKTGGFIYGAIVLIIILGCLNELIKDKCKKYNNNLQK